MPAHFRKKLSFNIIPPLLESFCEMPDMALPHSLRKIREPHAAGFRNISNLLRLLMTYIIPLLVVGGLILCGLDRSGHPLRYVREH